MIYLDHGATSFPKPLCVRRAVADALASCANPGRGGYDAAMAAARKVYGCRELAAQMFDCTPEQVVFTGNCTQGLNMAIRTLVRPGDRVVISGFEHNAVTRPLHLLGADTIVAGRRLFHWDEMLEQWENALQRRPKAAIFSHVSNVFGYILPVEQMAKLCQNYEVPLIVDAAQSAGSLPVKLKQWNAAFVAMPGHKGLQGPMGTGVLLCGQMLKPLLAGGTGSDSVRQEMPDYLPDIGEAGTGNVPGIAGLAAGIRHVLSIGVEEIFRREHCAMSYAAACLRDMGLSVFAGKHQGGTVSFRTDLDCEELAEKLGKRSIAVRAGLHCAPLAHESAGTLETGTVRLSFGPEASAEEVCRLQWELKQILKGSS